MAGRTDSEKEMARIHQDPAQQTAQSYPPPAPPSPRPRPNNDVELAQPSNVQTFCGLREFDLDRAVTSWFVPPSVVVAYRLVFAVYCTIGIVISVIDAFKTGQLGRFLLYFTYLSYIGLWAYFVVASIHSLSYLRNGYPRSLEKQPRCLTLLFLWLYETINAFCTLVPIIFWTALAPSEGPWNRFEIWVNVSVHALGYVLMMVEVTLSRMPLPTSGVVVALVILILYMLETFVVHWTAGFWVYPFLSWFNGAAVGFGTYFLVAVIAVLAFFAQLFVHWLRDKIGARLSLYNRWRLRRRNGDDSLTMAYF